MARDGRPDATGAGDEEPERSSPWTVPSPLRLLQSSRLSRQTRLTANQIVRRQVPSGARHAFRADFKSLLLAGLYSGAVFPFANFIAVKRLHTTNSLLSLMIAAPFLGNLLALVWARAMEGRSKVPFVTWSRFAAACCVATTLLAFNALPFALAISAALIVGTIGTPAYAAIIKEIYPEHMRGRLLSYTKSASVTGGIAGTLLGGFLLAHLKFHYFFPVAAMIGMAGATVFSGILDGSSEPGDASAEIPTRRTLELTSFAFWKEAGGAALIPTAWVALSVLLCWLHVAWPLAIAMAGGLAWAPRLPAFWPEIRATGLFVGSTLGILKRDVPYRWFALSVFTYGFGNLMHQPILPKLQANELGVRYWHLSLLTVTSQIVTVAAYFYWGRFVDLKSPQRAVVINVLLNTLVPLMYVLAGTVLPANPWVLFPAFVVTGVVNAGIDMAYFSAVLTFSGDANVSQYQALQSFLVGIRGSIAPFLGGFVVWVLESHGLNLRWVFAGSITLMVAGAVMQMVSMGRQGKACAS